jgi:hypothetical protein
VVRAGGGVSHALGVAGRSIPQRGSRKTARLLAAGCSEGDTSGHFPLRNLLLLSVAEARSGDSACGDRSKLVQRRARVADRVSEEKANIR